MKVPYHHYSEKGPRTTGRGIVIKGEQILLIERWRSGLHYFAIPGGGVEDDETIEETAVREIKEETSVTVELERLLYEMHDQDGHKHYVYLCRYLSGEAHLPEDSEEARQGPDNRFKPTWVPVEQVKYLPFLYWEPIRKLLVEDMTSGFSKSVKITAV